MSPRNFEEFWPFYIGEHRNPSNRILHYIGTGTGWVALLAAGATLNPLLIPAGIIFGYGCAWIGHFFIEKNKPASFKFPAWSFLADQKMLAYFLTGRMSDEIARLEKSGFRHIPATA